MTRQIFVTKKPRKPKAEAGRLMEAYEKTKAEADKAAEEITAAQDRKRTDKTASVITY